MNYIKALQASIKYLERLTSTARISLIRTARQSLKKLQGRYTDEATLNVINRRREEDRYKKVVGQMDREHHVLLKITNPS